MRRPEYAPDVKQMLSIDLDIDDAGEETLRKLAAESALQKIREARDPQFGVCFSVRERGWTIVFMVESLFGSCSMRLADREDHRDWLADRRERRAAFATRDGLSVDLPPIDQVTAGDIVAAIGLFIVQDVQDQ